MLWTPAHMNEQAQGPIVISLEIVDLNMSCPKFI